MRFNKYMCICWYALLIVGTIHGINDIEFVKSVIFCKFLFFQAHIKILLSRKKFN
jgi:hypothetical protein